ncbi:DEAD/DEAH box helicase [Pseudogracilibacillus auburnensis]|uniref:ATP-dependent RNA helicase CshB n=1 Tax=Pseudogracilibacillus auburnensis TaxID=1494959 RepID=A0A2V3WCK8_9BACI|nr:DEAD/DEAH box helicase [Pseudogracilibacillus auburnensis]PXW86509.1 ATP-dependent RNA helicase CshB [Pseudogracilibacillus auburnensis]
MDENNFNKLALNETIQKVIHQLYFKHPTEIQRKAIPHILAGKSMIGESQTGSGKTHAYLLPLLNKMDETKAEVQVIITAPTRELSMQIFEEIKTITKLAKKEQIWTSRLIVGGLDRKRMIKQLEKTPQIVVGTPGRILDMVNEGVLSIYSATSFVIDEADLMLDLRFIDTIDELLVRSKKDVQILVFSATFPQQLQHFLKKYLQQPTHIKIQNGLSPESMKHRLVEKKHQDLAGKVMDISKAIQPYVALLFTNSKETADELGDILSAKGLNVGVLHGGLSSRERKRMVKAIHDLRYEYIVATDLASRGIDIKGASHVINVELPKEIEFYIHRVGRTARAGLEGTAISFFTEADIPLIDELEKKGITFIYSDIKNGEWIESNHYNKRERRKDLTTTLDREAWKRVKKPKKVKPGYKKRMKQQQERIKRQLKKESRQKRT